MCQKSGKTRFCKLEAKIAKRGKKKGVGKKNDFAEEKKRLREKSQRETRSRKIEARIT